MIIQFTEAELQNLIIQPVARPECSAVYLEEREQAWVAQMERVLARNGHMWNGELYTLDEIQSLIEGQVVLRLGTCEYKDLVFQALQGGATIATRFGENHCLHFSGVICVPVTLDGKFVFGIRADRGEPTFGGIGGNLNKDEQEVHSFTDICQSMLREIQEETALPCQMEDLRFFGLHVSGGMHIFWFTALLPINSADINQYHRPGEFSSLITMTQSEAFDPTLPITGAFRRWRPYLHLLSPLLDGAEQVALPREE